MMDFTTPTFICMAASHMVTAYQDLPLLLMTTGINLIPSLCSVLYFQLLAYVTCNCSLCSTILIEPQCLGSITKHGDVCIKVCIAM